MLPFFILFWLWQYSLRFQYSPQTEKILRSERRMLCLAWHNRIFFLATLKFLFRSKFPMTGLVSASKDGAYLAAFFNLCKISSVRGSYMRRGAGAIRDLARTLKHSDVAITPDGPRGPVHKAKKGFLVVAKITNVRIVLLRLKPHHSIKIKKTWDNFAIPLPFSKVDFHAIEFDNIDHLISSASAQNLSPEDFINQNLMF